MTNPATDAAFIGSIPAVYEHYLVPMLFEPYAVDLARRLERIPGKRVLEIAAGTGVVTREMAKTLPASVDIVATDLNQDMLDRASAVSVARPIDWRVADAMALPFGNGEFDAVVCQFGVMFFPDKPRAYAEARRVLRPGGVFLYNVWGSVAQNDIADAVTRAMKTVFPDDPPGFLARTPYGYYDRAAHERDLAAAGFTIAPQFETVRKRCLAPTPLAPAIAFCHGTPLRTEIEAHGPARLDEATNAAAEQIAAMFGRGAIDVGMEAHIITAVC